jgi:hypothetical protein
MPDLSQSLQHNDLGHLRIVAGIWGVELKSRETQAALNELTTAMLNLQLAADIVESLPAEARSALDALGEAGGKIPWAAFARRFGEIREVGPGRRDREQVFLNPISPAETLFYRAVLARAFFDTSNGVQEHAYIPDDLYALIYPERNKGNQGKERSIRPLAAARPGLAPVGHPAERKERARPVPPTDRLVDDTTTLLAALRMGHEPPETRVPVQVVRQFLSAAKIIMNGNPQIEPVRMFLEADRQTALEILSRAWRASESFNELHQLPGLVCEGEWTNQPLVTREFLLSLMDAVPAYQWWSLPAFLRDIKEKYPDFQRPVGDYDSWFIMRKTDGQYLRGFVHWEEVDGALIRYLITGPLHWLGLVELAAPAENLSVSAFRMVINTGPPPAAEPVKLHVASQGRITVPRHLALAVRYQIARFCDWEDDTEDEYRYRVTTGSLEQAREQGLKVGQLLSLLARNAAAEIPPAFIRALKRWEKNGTEARVETQTVLRVSKPEVLEELRKSKAGRFLGEALGPAAVVVRPGAEAKVLAALAEMGLLAEDETVVVVTGKK